MDEQLVSERTPAVTLRALELGIELGLKEQGARGLLECVLKGDVVPEASLRGTEKDQSAVDEEHQSTIAGLGSLMG